LALLLLLRGHAVSGRTPLVLPAGKCEQRGGGEAEWQEVIEGIEEIAAANAEYKHEQRRRAENGECGVDEPACGPGSRAVHGPGRDTRR
jgi:hypothetical protein